jgi:hypothetical protein
MPPLELQARDSALPKNDKGSGVGMRAEAKLPDLRRRRSWRIM